MDHQYVGTLAPRSPFPVAFLSPDSLRAIGADNDELPELVVYRVVRSD
jgi:hypothetical protein